MDNYALNQLGGGLTGLTNCWPPPGTLIAYQPQIRLSTRAPLERRLEDNRATMKRLTESNEDVLEALELLNMHPYIERVRDLLARLGITS